MTASSYDRIYAVVRRIPRGKVATYGQVATLARLPGRARLVGYALAALPSGTKVPWHRVINAQGMLSLDRVMPGGGIVQRQRLEREGVRFAGRKVPLGTYRWALGALGRARST